MLLFKMLVRYSQDLGSLLRVCRKASSQISEGFRTDLAALPPEFLGGSAAFPRRFHVRFRAFPGVSARFRTGFKRLTHSHTFCNV